MTDTYAAEREKMVKDQLQARGLLDPRLLRVFGRLPRHEFVPDNLNCQAYRDRPLPIGWDQTISQPYMVAVMTQAAGVEPGHRILEIGSGSGYQSAILAELGAVVYTIERIPQLARLTRQRLRKLGYRNIHFKIANGTLGWTEEAPFHRILVTAGAPAVPEPLLEQLDWGGRLIIPLEEGLSQVLYTVSKTEGGIRKTRGEACAFVPLIGEYGWSGS
ncbi:MAG: protein-L-isoaspartate(D-aspartate) O-methyltransferase [Acidobacteriota bacterium]